MRSNVADILRYAPKGLNLYSSVCGGLTFEKVGDGDVILTEEGAAFNEDGKLILGGFVSKGAECVLFPSAACRSWFFWQDDLLKDGDFIADNSEDGETFIFYQDYEEPSNVIDIEGDKGVVTSSDMRYATPTEKEEFLSELKRNGFVWNSEKKELKAVADGIDEDITEVKKSPYFDNTQMKLYELQFRLIKGFNSLFVKLHEIEGKLGDIYKVTSKPYQFGQIDGKEDEHEDI